MYALIHLIDFVCVPSADLYRLRLLDKIGLGGNSLLSRPVVLYPFLPLLHFCRHCLPSLPLLLRQCPPLLLCPLSLRLGSLQLLLDPYALLRKRGYPVSPISEDLVQLGAILPSRQACQSLSDCGDNTILCLLLVLPIVLLLVELFPLPRKTVYGSNIPSRPLPSLNT